MLDRNIESLNIVFEDLSNIEINTLNIGLINMIGLETLQLNKQVKYIKEFDILIINNNFSIIDIEEFIKQTQNKNIRHFDIQYSNDKTERFYMMGKKDYEISLAKNEYDDIIFSIHCDYQKLTFEEIDRTEIVDNLLTDILTIILR